jgi:hypothetical protein
LKYEPGQKPGQCVQAKQKNMKKPKSIAKLKQDVQKVFNAWIRQRDSQDGFFTCISSGETLPVSQMNAGHYYPVGQYDGLRFDEDNCHGQSIRDNKFLYGNLIAYGENLPSRIGQERFDALKQRAAEYKRNGYKFSRTELMELLNKYR